MTTPVTRESSQAAHIARRFWRPAAKPTFNQSHVDQSHVDMKGIGAGANSPGPSGVSTHDRPDYAADTDHIPCAGFTPTSDKNGWLSKPFCVDASAQRRSPRPRSRKSTRERQPDVRPRPQQRTGPTNFHSCRCGVRPGTTIIGPLITYADTIATMNGTDYIYPVEPSRTTPRAT